MLFTSPIFLTLFLPVVLAGYFLLPAVFRNGWLLFASFVFYFWGEPSRWWVLVVSTGVNYALGLALSREGNNCQRKVILWAGIAWNIGLLVSLKYLHFLITNWNSVAQRLGWVQFAEVSLPLLLGISFFSFHAISYLMDVFRGETIPQKNFACFGLYMFLFPQLVAGPIVRYRWIEGQLSERRTDWGDLGYGVARFAVGLAKKVLLADKLGWYAERVFQTPHSELTPSFAWFGLLCYSLEIYFDFSGYSDMAVGLGRLFGFTLPENFAYPYASGSITEFWRKWHMSLSAWFRDYVYIPLGGNRRGSVRTYVNLWIVFLLCGLWHGANWTFVLWGVWHGSFLVMERVGMLRFVEAWPLWLRRAYVGVVVGVGWVYFRSDDVGGCVDFLKILFGLGRREENLVFFVHSVSPWTWVLIAIALVGCGPVLTTQGRRVFEEMSVRWGTWGELGFRMLRACGVGALLFGSAVEIVGGTFSPFIYFRF